MCVSITTNTCRYLEVVGIKHCIPRVEIQFQSQIRDHGIVYKTKGQLIHLKS